VWQLKRLVIQYCRYGGSSRGVRKFLVSEDYADWLRENPQIEVETLHKGGRHPHVLGEYVDGSLKTLCVRNTPHEEVIERINFLRNRRVPTRKISYSQHRHSTKRPSIQGLWDPNVWLKSPEPANTSSSDTTMKREETNNKQQKKILINKKD